MTNQEFQQSATIEDLETLIKKLIGIIDYKNKVHKENLKIIVKHLENDIQEKKNKLANIPDNLAEEHADLLQDLSLQEELFEKAIVEINIISKNDHETFLEISQEANAVIKKVTDELTKLR